MGKKDFPAIYSEACRELGSRPTIKVSHFSDRYHQDKNFAGVIVYHNRGSFTWYNERGVAKGYKGRAIYVIICCTDNWPAKAFKRAGEGMVHDYLYKFLFDNDFDERQTCCGGFAMMKGTLKYSSVWLNEQSSGSGADGQRPWQSDGSNLLSKGEELLVDIAVQNWKEGGQGIVIDIPDDVDMHIKMMSLSSALPDDDDSSPGTSSFEVGDRVRIKSSVTTPRLGWGPAMRKKRFEIGVVTSVATSFDSIQVEFPSSSRWSADASDLDKVTVVFKQGMKVMLRGSVEAPLHGIGGLERSEVGVVATTETLGTDSAAESDIKLYVDFLSQKRWVGRASEMHVIGYTD